MGPAVARHAAAAGGGGSSPSSSTVSSLRPAACASPRSSSTASRSCNARRSYGVGRGVMRHVRGPTAAAFVGPAGPATASPVAGGSRYGRAPYSRAASSGLPIPGPAHPLTPPPASGVSLWGRQFCGVRAGDHACHAAHDPAGLQHGRQGPHTSSSSSSSSSSPSSYSSSSCTHKCRRRLFTPRALRRAAPCMRPTHPRMQAGRATACP